jgi:hypothetical protein
LISRRSSLLRDRSQGIDGLLKCPNTVTPGKNDLCRRNVGLNCSSLEIPIHQRGCRQAATKRSNWMVEVNEIYGVLATKPVFFFPVCRPYPPVCSRDRLRRACPRHCRVRRCGGWMRADISLLFPSVFPPHQAGELPHVIRPTKAVPPTKSEILKTRSQNPTRVT